MSDLKRISRNISQDVSRMKWEWRTVREFWKDSKAAEYERDYLSPVVIKEKHMRQPLERLDKTADALKRLGVDL